jgi:hypothetical protein
MTPACFFNEDWSNAGVQQSVDKVNQDVDDVIAGNRRTVEPEVQRKGEIGERPRLHQDIPVLEITDVPDQGVVRNIGGIIELKWNLKRVGIHGQCRNNQQ